MKLYEQPAELRPTGKAPAKTSAKLLHLSNYLIKKTTVAAPPPTFSFWSKRAKFPIPPTGNRQYGSCTKSSQAILQMRAERLEQRRTIVIPEKNILDSYFQLTDKLYGGGDTGAYEMDALASWRKPDETFKDSKGRPCTIDAFVAINHRNPEEMKMALTIAGPKAIKVCFAMPAAWLRVPDGSTWDVSPYSYPVNDYAPYSGGGHSMCMISDYKTDKGQLPDTWEGPDWFVTWRAMMQYCDEAYLVIDSLNAWKKTLDVTNLKADVNRVSSMQIEPRVGHM